MDKHVLVLAPFRRPVFRTSISPLYPFGEPWDSPPLILSAQIEKAGFQTSYYPLINLFHAFNEETDIHILENLLRESRADIVIFSSDHFIPSRSTASLYGMKIISKILKEVNPEIKIGVTGRIGTVLKSKLFSEVENIDFVVVGEPEEQIGNIVRTIVSENLERAEEEFDCLLLKSSRKEPIPAMVNDLERVAPPAFHLLGPAFQFYEKYKGIKPFNIPFSIRTSLGCKFKCRFCSGVPNWLNYRKKSAKKIAEEIDSFNKYVGDKGQITFLEDEIFTRDEEHVEEIVRVFKEKDIYLEGLYTHSSLLTPTIAKLIQPVTNRVYLGLDNADDKILKRMGKGQKFETVLSAVQIARDNELKVHLEWIIGTPEETVDSIITSFSSIFNLLNTGTVDNINTYVYCPHPGTEYAEKSDKYGMSIVGDMEDIQESGGYATAQTQNLTRNQIFTAYLMSQLLINEVKSSRQINGPAAQVTVPNRNELRRIFESIKNESGQIEALMQV